MIDIILPTIGRWSLNAAIESVVHQDYEQWRLWVICDGFSFPDHSDKRVYTIGSNKPRHEDYGAWARNGGIDLGVNPWIAYIDDDDVWLPHHLSTLFSLLEAKPHATMLRTAGQAFSWKRKTPRTKKRVRRLGPINSTDILTVGMAHTRELFKQTAGWLPCDNHDKLLWHEMLSKGGSPAETDLVTFEFER